MYCDVCYTAWFFRVTYCVPYVECCGVCMLCRIYCVLYDIMFCQSIVDVGCYVMLRHVLYLLYCFMVYLVCFVILYCVVCAVTTCGAVCCCGFHPAASCSPLLRSPMFPFSQHSLGTIFILQL